MNFLREQSYRDVRLGNYGSALLNAAAAVAVSAQGILASDDGQVAAAVVLAGAGQGTKGCPQGARSSTLNFTPRQLQKGYGKHGGDFGLSGNWNPGKAAEFSRAINQHINDPSVVQIPGTYRGTQPVIHYYNPATGVNVIAKPTGEYVTGFSLTEIQLQDLLFRGNVQ